MPKLPLQHEERPAHIMVAASTKAVTIHCAYCSICGTELNVTTEAEDCFDRIYRFYAEHRGCAKPMPEETMTTQGPTPDHPDRPRARPLPSSRPNESPGDYWKRTGTVLPGSRYWKEVILFNAAASKTLSAIRCSECEATMTMKYDRPNWKDEFLSFFDEHELCEFRCRPSGTTRQYSAEPGPETGPQGGTFEREPRMVYVNLHLNDKLGYAFLSKDEAESTGRTNVAEKAVPFREVLPGVADDHETSVVGRCGFVCDLIAEAIGGNAIETANGQLNLLLRRVAHMAKEYQANHQKTN